MTVRCPHCGQSVESPPGVSVDLSRNEFVVGGTRYPLRPRSAEVLSLLLESYPEVVLSERLHARVFHWEAVGDRCIGVHIHYLRLGIAGSGYSIKNEWGRGYRLVKDSDEQAVA